MRTQSALCIAALASSRLPIPVPGPDIAVIEMPGLNASGLQWCGWGKSCAVLTVLGRRFELVLQQHELFALGASTVGSWATLVNTTFDHHERWLSGAVAGDPGSAVRVTSATDGRFHGSIHTGDAGVYIVELGAVAGTVVVYHERALPVSARSPGHRCGSSAASPWNHPRKPPVLLPLSPQHRTVRRRRNSAETVCRVFLDADESFLEYWGGPTADPTEERVARATLKMIEIIYQVDGIYSREYNIQSLLSLKIAGAKVHRGVRFAGRDGSAVLRKYQNWLSGGTTGASDQMRPRGPKHPGPDDVCLNHVFTHAPAGGVLGVAIQAYPGSIEGGLCAKAGDTGVSTNVGFTNTMGEDGNVVPIWQSVLSTAHEFGHNIGAVHDCVLSGAPSSGDETTQLCPVVIGTRCLPEEVYGGAFLMFPAIGTDVSGPNSRVFSPCSVEKIFAVIEAKGGCLEEPSPCGASDKACCNEHFTVADDTSCSLSAPAPGFSGGGGGEQWIGRCKFGACVGPHDEFCASLSLSVDTGSTATYVGCTVPGLECLRACAVLGEPGSCALRSAKQQPLIGSLCTAPDGLDGICTNTGACVRCDGPDCPKAGSGCRRYTKDGLSTPCSQPCGGGTKAQSYRCECGAGCTDLSSSFQILECRQNACTTSGLRTVEVDLFGANPDTLDVTGFEEAGRQLLEFPITVTKIVKPRGVTNATRCMVVVEACRNYKESVHCLSAAELRDELSWIEARWVETEPPLGYTVALRVKPSSSSSGSRRLEPWEIVLLGAGLLVLGVLGGVLVTVARRRANRRAGRTDHQSDRPGSRHRPGSSGSDKPGAKASNHVVAGVAGSGSGGDSARSLATTPHLREHVI